jgi:hypothetical protein
MFTTRSSGAAVMPFRPGPTFWNSAPTSSGRKTLAQDLERVVGGALDDSIEQEEIRDDALLRGAYLQQLPLSGLLPALRLVALRQHFLHLCPSSLQSPWRRTRPRAPTQHPVGVEHQRVGGFRLGLRSLERGNRAGRRGDGPKDEQAPGRYKNGPGACCRKCVGAHQLAMRENTSRRS